MANETFTRLFDAWGYSAAFMFLGQPGICQFIHLQSFTSCLRPALILLWNNAMREMFNFCFLGNVSLVLTKF